MILFEATNGHIGESYVRRYIWALDADRAFALLGVKPDFDGNYETDWRLVVLMHSDSTEFITEVSSSGWERSTDPVIPWATNVVRDQPSRYSYLNLGLHESVVPAAARMGKQMFKDMEFAMREVCVDGQLVIEWYAPPFPQTGGTPPESL